MSHFSFSLFLALYLVRGSMYFSVVSYYLLSLYHLMLGSATSQFQFSQSAPILDERLMHFTTMQLYSVPGWTISISADDVLQSISGFDVWQTRCHRESKKSCGLLLSVLSPVDKISIFDEIFSSNVLYSSSALPGVSILLSIEALLWILAPWMVRAYGIADINSNELQDFAINFIIWRSPYELIWPFAPEVFRWTRTVFGVLMEFTSPLCRASAYDMPEQSCVFRTFLRRTSNWARNWLLKACCYAGFVKLSGIVLPGLAW